MVSGYADIAQADTATKPQACVIDSLRSASSQLHGWELFTYRFNCEIHQSANSGLIDGLEGVFLEDTFLQILGQKAELGIVTRQSTGRFREVTCPEGHEICDFR